MDEPAVMVVCCGCGRQTECITVSDGTVYRPFAWEFPDPDTPLRGFCRACSSMAGRLPQYLVERASWVLVPWESGPPLMLGPFDGRPVWLVEKPRQPMTSPEDALPELETVFLTGRQYRAPALHWEGRVYSQDVTPVLALVHRAVEAILFLVWCVRFGRGEVVPIWTVHDSGAREVRFLPKPSGVFITFNPATGERTDGRV